MWIWLFSLFVLVSAAHLAACLLAKGRLQAVTKCFLMPLLALCLLPLGGKQGAFLFAGALFGFLGDVCLLFTKRTLLFLLGIGAFGLGHVCYAAAFALEIGPLPFYAVLLPGLVYLAAILLIYGRLRPYLPREMRLMAFSYMLLICVMSLCAVLRFLSGPSVLTALPAAGSVFFLVSDTRLSFEVFRGKTKRGDFFVMLSYLLAQALILFPWF